jgi:hypothetical protein
MTSNQIPPDYGSFHPKDFVILTPSQIEVPAGEEFTSSVTVWPAGLRHVVTAFPPDGSNLQVKVSGHKVTVTGRLGCVGEKHSVQVTVRDGAEVAHDTLTVEATETPSPLHAGAYPHQHRR